MHFLKLIRWPNLLIIAATMYVLRYFLLIPLLEHNGVAPMLGEFNFFLLCVSTLLLTAGGYITNDIQDVDADNINKPEKVIIGNNIGMRTAENIHLFINALAIGIGVYISYAIGLRSVSLAFLLVAGLLYFYSTTYKGITGLGNVMVAFFAALVPVMVLLFELPLLKEKYKVFEQSSNFNFNFLIFWFGFYALFSFLVNLVREIIKDIEDFEGDMAFGKHTLPVKFGTKISKLIAILLLVITIICIAIIIFRYLNDPFSLMYILSLIMAPMGYLTYKLWYANEKAQFTQASLMCKIIMLTGVAYVFVANIVAY